MPRGLYFSKALFEGLIFGGAYLWREVCVSKSIGLAERSLVGNKFTVFALSYLHLRATWRGDLTEGFLSVTSFGGLYLEGFIHGGAYFRYFTVYAPYAYIQLELRVF